MSITRVQGYPAIAARPRVAAGTSTGAAGAEGKVIGG